MLKIRRPLGRLIFNMGIAIPGKTVFLIETAPWYHFIWGGFHSVHYNCLFRGFQKGHCPVQTGPRIPRNLSFLNRRSFEPGSSSEPVLTGPLGTNVEILSGIQTFSFNGMHLKMSSAKWRPLCLGLNVLKMYVNIGANLWASSFSRRQAGCLARTSSQYYRPGVDSQHRQQP